MGPISKCKWVKLTYSKKKNFRLDHHKTSEFSILYRVTPKARLFGKVKRMKKIFSEQFLQMKVAVMVLIPDKRKLEQNIM